MIALVVTIILIIILAGVAISLIFGKSGLIVKSKESQQVIDVATAKDRLELIKSEIPLKVLDNKNGEVNLKNYLEELNKSENLENCGVTNINQTDDINAEITVNGKYKFLAHDTENGNVEIIYLGESGTLEIEPVAKNYTYPIAGTFEVIKNESGGNLSVKSSDENIATATIDGNIVTVTPKAITEEQGQKTIDIIVTSEANENYAQGKVIHKATINKGIIELDAVPYVGEYDGKSHNALLNVTVSPNDCRLEYSLDGGTFNTQMPQVTMASGKYSITIKASKDGYRTNEITKTVTVNKNNKENNLELSSYSGTLTYPEKGTFTVTKNTSNGTLSVKSNDENVAKATISGNVVTITPQIIEQDGKQAIITVTSAETSNYKTQTKKYEVTVNRGTIDLDAEIYTGIYDGQAHNSISNIKVVPNDAKLEYSIDGGKTYTTNIPTVTNVGEFSVKIKASKSGYIERIITKENGKIERQGSATVTTKNGTYDGTVQTCVTGENVDFSGAVSATNAGEYKVNVTPKANYAWSDGTTDTKEVTFTIGKKELTVTAEAKTKTYGEANPELTYKTAGAVSGQTPKFSGSLACSATATSGVGTYNITQGTLALADNGTFLAGNYQIAYTGAKLTVNAKNASTFTATLATTSYTYDGTAKTPAVTVKDGSTALTNGTHYTVAYSNNVNAGTGKVTITGKGNYTGTKELTFTINKATGTLSLSATSGTITYPSNGSFTITSNTSGGTLSVKSSDETVATASVSGTTVTITPKAPTTSGKKTTITVTSGATNNYEAQTETYVATVNMGTISLSATIYDGNYDGKDHDAITKVTVTPSDAKVEYSLNGGTYNTTIPKVNNIGTYSITIRATKEGFIKAEKTITFKITSSVYAKLYTDGTLILSSTNYTDASRTISEDYGDVSSDTNPKWVVSSTNKASNIIIYDKIQPIYINSWFRYYKGTSLDLKNIDTSNVTDMYSMFSGCSNLTSLDLSTFNTSKVTNMSYMFNGCSNLTSLDLSSLDTSKVTNMSSMFNSCSKLTNLDLSNFNTSSVTNMYSMFGGIFAGCSSLTSLDLSNFDTSKVTNMSYMFYGCSKLTSLDLSSFNTSSVTDMSKMFSGFMSKGCSSLTSLDLNNFDTSKVKNMSNMFSGCSNLTSLDLRSFNKNSVTDMSNMFSSCSNLTNLNLSSFDTSSAINMNQMFYYCSKLTSLDLNNFNTSSVTNMSSMFNGCSSLTSLDLRSFNKNSVTDMSNMFSSCSNLTDLNLSSFDTSSTINMNQMFYYCSNLADLNLSSFDTSKVTNMSSMFNGCSSLTSLDLRSFNKNSVTDMSYMFRGCSSLTSLNLSSFDTSKVTNMSSMFSSCSNLTDLNLSSFDTSKVTNMSYMFYKCSKLTSLDLNNFDTSKVTNMSSMFCECSKLTSLDLSNFDTSKVTNMSSMFSGCSNLTDLNLSNFDTSKVTNMSYMFRGCSSLTSLNLSSFNTSNVTDMSCMFGNEFFRNGCSSLTSLDLSNFDTSKVTNMSSMFYGCSKLTSLDLSNFDTSKVTNMGDMFYDCKQLTNLDLSSFNTSNVTNMSYMFGGSIISGCSSLTSLNLSNFDTSKVTNMNSMFFGCSKLTSLDLKNFDTSNVTNMYGMFEYCSKLTSLDLSNFDTSKVTNMSNMFYDCSELTSLDLRSFDTSSVTNMYKMFGLCLKLKSIVVGQKWVINTGTTTTDMFINCGTQSVTKQ